MRRVKWRLAEDCSRYNSSLEYTAELSIKRKKGRRQETPDFPEDSSVPPCKASYGRPLTGEIYRSEDDSVWPVHAESSSESLQTKGSRVGPGARPQIWLKLPLNSCLQAKGQKVTDR